MKSLRESLCSWGWGTGRGCSHSANRTAACCRLRSSLRSGGNRRRRSSRTSRQSCPPRCRGLFQGVATPAILCLCIKNQLRHPKPPYYLLLAGSLWHKGAHDRTFPCMEANYPHKEPASSTSRVLWMRGAGSLLHKIAGVSNTLKPSTNESRASTFLDQWEWRTLPPGLEGEVEVLSQVEDVERQPADDEEDDRGDEEVRSPHVPPLFLTHQARPSANV